MAADGFESLRIRLHRVAAQRPMNVQVDKSRHEEKSIQVDHLLSPSGSHFALRNLLDYPFVDPQMSRPHNPVRQDEMGAGQDHARCHSGLFA